MKKFLIITLAIMLLAAPVVSFAASQSIGSVLSGVATGIGYSDQVTEQTLAITVATLLRLFFSLLGIIFLVIILYAGFRWMMAGGNEEQITEAKRWIRNGIIGLAIIIASYAITYFVTAALTYSVYMFN